MIDWNEVESAVAQEDGLHVVQKDGTLGMVSAINQIPLQDDIAFWSRQMTEHALFLHLLLEEPTLKAQAKQLHQLWQAGGDLNVALNELMAFKQMIMGRLKSGEWLGWALLSFVEHILYEAQYFRARLSGNYASNKELGTWIRIVKDHADVGPKFIDPTANNYAAQAAPLSAKLGQLQQNCGVGCLHEVDQAFQAANVWVQGIPSGLNTVHPVLKEHILRENTRGLQVTRILEGRR